MGGLTGVEYMVNAVRGVLSDRVPVTLLVGPFCARWAGVPLGRILTDPAASARAQTAFYERFLPDNVIVVNDVYLESEALGCEIPLNATEDRVAHYFDCARAYGRTFMDELRQADPGRFA